MKHESDFHLRFVIEYYISAARQHNSENKFIIGYIGLECLASNAPRYAKKLGERIENKGSVIVKEKAIKDILRKHDQKLPENLIQEIASKVAYKEIGDKLTIPYLASNFGIKIDENILDELAEFRNSFMHTGRDKKKVAKMHYDNLLNILERTLLSILGWKGNEYIDKLSGFSLKTLN